jgi:hypothetical protein
VVQSRYRADMRATWNRILNTKTPLSPGALPAATTVGKLPSACIERIPGNSWNINPILPREKTGAIRATNASQMDTIDPGRKVFHQLIGCRGEPRSRQIHGIDWRRRW